MHPDATTPRTTASAASERTVRLRDTDATPKKDRPEPAGQTGRGPCNLPTARCAGLPLLTDLWTTTASRFCDLSDVQPHPLRA